MSDQLTRKIVNKTEAKNRKREKTVLGWISHSVNWINVGIRMTCYPTSVSWWLGKSYFETVSAGHTWQPWSNWRKTYGVNSEAVSLEFVDKYEVISNMRASNEWTHMSLTWRARWTRELRYYLCQKELIWSVTRTRGNCPQSRKYHYSLRSYTILTIYRYFSEPSKLCSQQLCFVIISHFYWSDINGIYNFQILNSSICSISISDTLMI